MLDKMSEYDHQETKKLLNETRIFFKNKLKIVISEWCTREEETQNNIKNIDDIFYIEKANKPIYEDCVGMANLETILDCFESRIGELSENLYNLLDNNSDLDEASSKSLESYARAVDKCMKVYRVQRRKRNDNFNKLDTVKEIRTELQLFFGEIISKYIIIVLLDALYERLKNDSGQIYQIVVEEINEFLKKNGIYTKKIIKNEIIEPEFVEPTADSSNNFTDDFRKFDTIEEIRRYPYLFSDGGKIIDGCAKIWRKRN